MIGWWIVISTQTPQQRDAGGGVRARMAAILAHWEVGPGGIDWLEALVKAGKAEQLRAGGYPSRYTAKAGHVLPLLADGPLVHTGPAVIGDDYVMPAKWCREIELHAERIAACAPDQRLTIDAWDQS